MGAVLQRQSAIKVGDIVKYSDAFVRNIAADFDLANRRGTVRAVFDTRKPHYARIDWADGSASSALLCNLKRA